MKNFKVTWEEFVSPGKGFNAIWKKDSSSVSSENAGDAIRVIKRRLGDWHIERFKCKNFKSTEIS
jgi:hypothetical protein